MKTYLLILILFPLVVFGFGTGTTKKIDTIENNTETDILLKPTTSVKIDNFTGNFVLQSSGAKAIEESTVTNTELSYLSGVTSALQTQIDGKEPTLPWNTYGDMTYYQTSSPVKIPIGTIGQVLTVGVANTVLWEPAPVSTTLTTKGDIQTFDTANQRLGVGTDEQVLISDSAEATGLKWIDIPGVTPTTTEGDLIVRGVTEDERLGVGAAFEVLTSDGTTASWSPSVSGGALPVIAKGGLITSNGIVNGEHTPCANGEILEWDSTEVDGVKCIPQPTIPSSVYVELPAISFNEASTSLATHYTFPTVILEAGMYEIGLTGTTGFTGYVRAKDFTSPGSSVVGFYGLSKNGGSTFTSQFAMVQTNGGATGLSIQHPCDYIKFTDTISVTASTTYQLKFAITTGDFFEVANCKAYYRKLH